MRFDWKRFCEHNRIRFVTWGANVARGHINIKCPYCGNNDPSEHMGLKLDVSDPAWGCFRNAEHRGRNPRRLVQRLLDCSFEHAISLVDLQTSHVDDFDRLVDALRNPVAPEAQQKQTAAAVDVPKDFKPLRDDDTEFSARFIRYLAGRGFGTDVYDVCDTYDLRYALTGPQAHRVVMLVRKNGALLSWTGRDIRENASVRYKNRAETDKALLFNYDVAVAKMPDCPVLVMVEGPIDCYKIDFYGFEAGATCVGILGTAVPPEQLTELAVLLKGFELGVMLLDADAKLLNMQLADQLRELSRIPVATCFLDAEVHDPGKLSKAEVKRICEGYAARVHR